MTKYYRYRTRVTQNIGHIALHGDGTASIRLADSQSLIHQPESLMMLLFANYTASQLTGNLFGWDYLEELTDAISVANVQLMLE